MEMTKHESVILRTSLLKEVGHALKRISNQYCNITGDKDWLETDYEWMKTEIARIEKRLNRAEELQQFEEQG